ncbi:hypothetical protein RY831_17895 [Noviherbaspirillum sp. CPCC 100848]|uniref:Uncharacterized protein n=1 Tax=Noviherbaspirillum album TaxID=3080276 RepID=A0ABU6JBL9_9BURK|nr:hypothetical protein [Noviherbaspirillum sp. CPCC 100848]MEC4721042.1 hypothetical protein [Noviherbaspirillum sp. CPCC 100848]
MAKKNPLGLRENGAEHNSVLAAFFMGLYPGARNQNKSAQTRIVAQIGMNAK